MFRTSLGNIRPGDTVSAGVLPAPRTSCRATRSTPSCSHHRGSALPEPGHLAADPRIQNPYTEAAMPGQSGLAQLPGPGPERRTAREAGGLLQPSRVS